jgi:hypothetical protein
VVVEGISQAEMQKLAMQGRLILLKEQAGKWLVRIAGRTLWVTAAAGAGHMFGKLWLHFVIGENWFDIVQDELSNSTQIIDPSTGLNSPIPVISPHGGERVGSADINFSSSAVLSRTNRDFKCPCLKDGEGAIVYGPISGSQRTGVLGIVTNKFALANGSSVSINARTLPGYMRATNAGRLVHAGHLWASRLGGSGGKRSNLVTLDSKVNISPMKRTELSVRKTLMAGNTFCGASLPSYFAGDDIPYRVILGGIDSKGNIFGGVFYQDVDY